MSARSRSPASPVQGSCRELRRGRGVWSLAEVLADRFEANAKRDRLWWFAPRGSTRIAEAAHLLVADRHVAADGSALLLLGPGQRAGPGIARRAALMLAGVLVVSAAAAVFLGRWAPEVLFVAVLALVSRGWLTMWRDRKRRAQLKALRPRGARLVHSLARARWAPEGRGRQLMEELHEIADARGWALVLDTDHPRLVDFYERLGYRPVGEGVVMSSGRTRWAMVRESSAVEVL